jgi:hypothetical protein
VDTKYCYGHQIENKVHGAHGEEKIGACKILIGKSEGRRPLVRSRRRWEYSIKMDFGEIRIEDVHCISWSRIETGGWLL